MNNRAPRQELVQRCCPKVYGKKGIGGKGGGEDSERYPIGGAARSTTKAKFRITEASLYANIQN
jgi:hypothetical protein